MLEEIYLEEFGIMNLIATILAWIIGIIFIWGGKSTKDVEDVQVGLGIMVFGSIPFFNGMALSLILIIGGAALIGAGINYVGRWLADKIIGDES